MRPDISFLARYVLGHGNTTARCRADVISFDRQVLAAVRDSISALVAPACARAGLPRPSPGADAGPAALCGCRILCHLMQPGNIRGSGRRAGPAAEPGYLLLPRLDPRARRADSGARPGAAGGCCSDRRTHPGPAAGAVHR